MVEPSSVTLNWPEYVYAIVSSATPGMSATVAFTLPAMWGMPSRTISTPAPDGSESSVTVAWSLSGFE